MIKRLILFIILIYLCIFLQIQSVWSFHLKFSSTMTPRNIVDTCDIVSTLDTIQVSIIFFWNLFKIQLPHTTFTNENDYIRFLEFKMIFLKQIWSSTTHTKISMLQSGIKIWIGKKQNCIISKHDWGKNIENFW